MHVGARVSARDPHRHESEISRNSGPQQQNKTFTTTFGYRKMVASDLTQSAEQLGQDHT